MEIPIESEPTTTSPTITNKPNFRQIGYGGCGSVWSPDRVGASCAIKREDGGSERNLYNDFIKHQLILSKSPLPPQILVPQCNAFIRATDKQWWDSRLPRFPKGYEMCNVLITERIPPCPRDVRESLIEKYCPERNQEEIKKGKPNEDCIIRIYLGRRRTGQTSRFFSLRNFPL